MPEGDRTDLDETLAGGDRRHRLARFAALGPGTRFGPRYVLHERLGAGGAGEVFRATDTFAGAEVALKVLFPRDTAADAAETRSRLRREAQLVRALRHPNVVRLHDIGEQDGLLYLVMERLDGETLRQRLARDGRLPPDEAVAILRAVLEALAAAHEAGIVHRDVKPGNIFFAREARGGERVVLLDFGLARANADAALTQTGQFLGTPEYVSPEQARGERDVGPASDLYAAGVLLWEMLAGAPPFTGSAVSVVAAHAQNPLPPVRAALPGAPAWLRDLARHLLEKDPARRPADARAALRRLERRRPRNVFARRRGLAARVALAGAALLALALGAGALFLPYALVVDQTDDNALLAQTRSGASWRVPLPDRAGFVLPLGPLPWRPLVSLKGPDNVVGRYVTAPGFPWGLARVDALTRSVTPLRLRPEAWSAGPRPEWFPHFDMPPCVKGLSRLDAGGESLYAALYRHPTHYPSLALLFDGDGAIRALAPHPGELLGSALVPRDGERPALLVVGGENHDVGQRGVACALPVVERFRSPRVHHFPPYGMGANWAPPTWCYFFSDDRFASVERGPGGLVAVGRASGRGVRLDERTGVPLDAADREGLTPEQWRAASDALTVALMRAAHTAERGGPAAAAAWLLATADRVRPRALAGIARARAAEFLRDAGLHEPALAAVERALRDEPAVLGHVRLEIDVLVRLGRAREVRSRVLRGDWAATKHGEVAQDLVMAALLDDRPEAVADLARAGVEPLQTDYYAHLAAASLALHAGDGTAALGVLTDPRNPVDGPEVAARRALALALHEAPDFRRAAADLEVADGGRGSGQALPLVPLRAFLAARAGARWPGAVLPGDAALRRALDDADAAARHNLMDLYLQPWSEALAAGAARLSGDEPTARELFASARARPGAGPYIDRLEALSRRQGTPSRRQGTPSRRRGTP